ncbi:MAG: SAM-dependent methyltransferase [Bacteroidales bacterium]
MSKKTETYYDAWTRRYMESGYGDVIQAHRPTDVHDLLRYTAEQTGIRDGITILDAGCGVCGPAIYFAQNFDVKIHALSISGEQIRISENRIRQAELQDQIFPQKGDFHHLNDIYPAEHFDLIIMLESYGHAARPKELIQSAERVLKKNGQIYIKDYFQKEITGSKSRRKAVKKAIKKMNTIYAYKLPDLYDTLQHLRQADLSLQYVQRHQLPLDNEKSVRQFEADHGIDLYDGGYNFIFLEPLELLFRKPESRDEPIA